MSRDLEEFEDQTVVSTENCRLDQEVYYAERRLLIDARRESVRSFDKTMVTLSGGSLALSLGFITDVVTTMHLPLILAAAWGFFAIAVLLTLLSFLTSRRSFDYLIESLDALQREEPVPPRDSSSAWTNRLNIAAIATLVLGVANLLFFTVINLPK